ncbi:septal ring lytic transglycosylase RlpA family protein [Shewanella intestini]|uniref:Endolytic peptidoglycan transglycosylase RlpA n=1 Tax=Shewanella intestini TaxID=2017544 RepID=A0ABS5I5Y6_9GAMM|nr:MULTISPECIES: septal ring lytic transglycosylase RlpA family protein [Shewanella]MBR9729436.1 septal ring lytic transglycosylase RlpA family protein [Shewanella intestini]MRG35103.1 septal ring lytic transglycosylase RlpA family protein [Shewanella sp. XMDDZSB0408]
MQISLKRTLQLVSASMIVSLTLSGCSTSNQPKSQSDRYQLKHDVAPTNAPDVSKIEDAHPRYEPYSRQGNNMTYTVKGKSYTVLDTAKGFTETGEASWYGAKFHGHLTSNGETYDMYSMTAAHKTLPLPSYVKVTNLANNKQVIVRVNDRGPFHPGRIIDLSYAAAYKIDMLKTGTAKVSIETIHFDSPHSIALANLQDDSLHFVQVVALKDKNRVEALAQQMSKQYDIANEVVAGNGFYRLQLGPINQQHLAEQLLQKIKQRGYPQSYLLQKEPNNSSH